MLTARQARALAWASNHKSVFDQFNKIGKMIEAAANNGEYMLILREYIFPKVKEDLCVSGYTIRYDDLIITTSKEDVNDYNIEIIKEVI